MLSELHLKYNTNMDISTWKKRLEELPLGNLYLYQEIGSTNLEAEALVLKDAPHLSLVLADSQITGKGRQGRTWVTRAGKALAFSLILFPKSGQLEPESLGRLSGLAALAVAETLQDKFGLPAQIKWPNDVLVSRKKVAGVLVDVHWQGDRVQHVVLGIGINVNQGSVPEEIPLNFPATSLEEAAGNKFSRLDLLVNILESLLRWYSKIQDPALIQSWNACLAFKNEQVMLTNETSVIDQGIITGIAEDGSLILLSANGEERLYHSGEIQLRLVDRS